MKPCKRGHTRRYKSGACIDCMVLRKGRSGRKVPPTRIDKILKAARNLGKVTREEIKLRKETARAARLKLREENNAKSQTLRKAEHARLAAKDTARRRGYFENLGAFSPDAARAVEQSAPPAPGHFTSFKDNPFPPERDYIVSGVDDTGRLKREYLPPPRAESKPKVAESADYVKPGPAAGGERRQPTRAELAARHRHESMPNAGGFFDAGGVVAMNIQNEHGGATVHVCRGLVPWPR